MATSIRKILIIRFRRVGDAVLSSVLCSSFRQSFPQAEIHYVLNQNIAPLFMPHPDVDKVIPFSDAEQKSFLTYIGKVRRLMKSEHYDLIIDTRSTIKSLWFSLFSLHTPWRIGRKKAYNIFLQNYRIPLSKYDEVTNTLRLLSPLKQQYAIREERNFRLECTDVERQDFAHKLAQNGVDTNKPIIVCAVTARLESKVWTRSQMVETLRRILNTYPNAQLIFNYAGEREKQNAFAIWEELGCNPRIFIHLEANTLREMVAMFSFTSFFFGNEGGPRHISQAMNVPGFAIYSPAIAKSIWLVNEGERTQGIELADVDMQAANDNRLTFEEKFSRITADAVWQRLHPMLQRFLA